MKNTMALKYSLLILLTIGTIFTLSIVNAQQVVKKEYTINCKTWDCINENKNTDAIIEGVFRKYTPNKTGKGAGHMFWDWEIMLADSFAVPVNNSNVKIKYQSFEGKKVLIKGNIFYGIIIGTDDENTQNARGFRIDPAEIEEKKK